MNSRRPLPGRGRPFDIHTLRDSRFQARHSLRRRKQMLEPALRNATALLFHTTRFCPKIASSSFSKVRNPWPLKDSSLTPRESRNWNAT